MTEQADLEAAVAELRTRVTQLEDERAIVDLLHRHGPAIDDGDSDAWADLFTTDGVWEVGGPAARIRLRLEGRAELRAFAARHTRAPEAWHKHCVVDARITVDGNRASAASYSFRLDGFEDGPTVQSFGRYVDELERADDGCWRIAHRTLVVESTRPSPFGYRPDTVGTDAST